MFELLQIKWRKSRRESWEQLASKYIFTKVQQHTQKVITNVTEET